MQLNFVLDKNTQLVKISQSALTFLIINVLIKRRVLSKSKSDCSDKSSIRSRCYETETGMVLTQILAAENLVLDYLE